MFYILKYVEVGCNVKYISTNSGLWSRKPLRKRVHKELSEGSVTSPALPLPQGKKALWRNPGGTHV